MQKPKTTVRKGDSPFETHKHDSILSNQKKSEIKIEEQPAEGAEV